MFIQAFPKLGERRAIRLLQAFFRSPVYFALIVALMVVAEIFSLELAVFYLYLAIGALALMVTEDTLAVMPMVLCGYLCISPENNAAHFPGATCFTLPSFEVQFIFILTAAVLLLLGRTVMMFTEDPRRGGYPRLAIGFAALGIAYMLGGAFTSHYSSRTALFGFVQLAALLLPYLFFLCTVNWEKTDKSFLPMLFTLIGTGVFIEILDMYTLPGVFREDGTIFRAALFTGWGVYNNVGCIMAMCIPAPAYFAAERKNGWLYGLLSDLFLLGVALTQSRGAIVFGAVTYLMTVVFVLAASKGKERWKNVVQYAAIFVLLIVAYFSFRTQLSALFASLIEIEMDSNGRFEIYRNCLNAFLGSPVIGVGFYDTPGFAFQSVGNFLPPRAHNTYIQLLATGGCVAMAAYVFHRVQTLLLLFERRSSEKWYVFLSAASLMLTSILDCHFFNIGPGILYAVMFAYAEGMDRCMGPRERRVRKGKRSPERD